MRTRPHREFTATMCEQIQTPRAPLQGQSNLIGFTLHTIHDRSVSISESHPSQPPAQDGVTLYTALMISRRFSSSPSKVLRFARVLLYWDGGGDESEGSKNEVMNYQRETMGR